MSSTAVWLNEAFYGFDHGLLSLYHSMAEGLGGLLTPLMRIITLLGEKGLIFFLLAFIFMLTASKRDLGVCIFGAVCCGALITNIILKDSIARPRPFEGLDEYYQWWVFVGSPAEDGFSFPSGHVTACAAGMTAIWTMKGKKWVLPSAIIVFFMALSRNYLMAHYPSDVLAASIVGLFSGVVAWFITQLIFRFLRARGDIALFEFVLEFDIRDVLPFELPHISQTGSVAAFIEKVKGILHSPAKAPVRRRKAEEALDEDADMKRYGDDEDVKTYVRPAPKSAAKEEPAPRKAVAAGRHEAPSGSTKKKSRSIPGTYKGKHEL